MKSKVLLLPFALLFSICSHANAPAEAGRTIFSSRCASCHNVNKIVMGPALAGIDERRPIEWIVKFVQSSQTLIKGGDLYAAALYEKFNKIPMPDHPDLSGDDIKGIVEYVKSSTVAGAGPERATFRPEKSRPAYLPLSIHNYFFISAYLALILLLCGSLLTLVKVKNVERKMGKKDK